MTDSAPETATVERRDALKVDKDMPASYWAALKVESSWVAEAAAGAAGNRSNETDDAVFCDSFLS